MLTPEQHDALESEYLRRLMMIDAAVWRERTETQDLIMSRDTTPIAGNHTQCGRGELTPFDEDYHR